MVMTYTFKFTKILEFSENIKEMKTGLKTKRTQTIVRAHTHSHSLESDQCIEFNFAYTQ